MADGDDLTNALVTDDLNNANNTDPGNWVLVNVPSAGIDTVYGTISGVTGNFVEVDVNGSKYMVQCDINVKVQPAVQEALKHAGLTII